MWNLSITINGRGTSQTGTYFYILRTWDESLHNYLTYLETLNPLVPVGNPGTETNPFTSWQTGPGSLATLASALPGMFLVPDDGALPFSPYTWNPLYNWQLLYDNSTSPGELVLPSSWVENDYSMNPTPPQLTTNFSYFYSPEVAMGLTNMMATQLARWSRTTVDCLVPPWPLTLEVEDVETPAGFLLELRNLQFLNGDVRLRISNPVDNYQVGPGQIFYYNPRPLLGFTYGYQATNMILEKDGTQPIADGASVLFIFKTTQPYKTLLVDVEST